MATKINDRVPIHVLRPDQEGGAHEPAELIGCRFMGVLLHPVPWTEMERRFDVPHHGFRLAVHWPVQDAEHPVAAGDVLQVGDARHIVRGVVEHPGCFLGIYVEET